ncbi:cupredoxin domain-containing protein [Cupriavidus metallidurans]|jgi:cytochrome c oxidase subunit II|uniref:cupredoxin domain-containing protein n=1 Tax=Cupriavidus metallidurans TaxID=119219 RepID=UPI00076369B9|nr:cupredoxin domain-containing protein [Cupriavidus metallidurans]KWW36239.1 cytochrome c oxidase subunit 2 [Cupriavidus metallidurans]
MSTANASRRTLLGWMLAAAVMPVVSVVSRSDAAAPRVIPMRARRFVFIPDRVKLKAGETVVLSITAEDVVMGFSAPDFDVRADLPPGEAIKVTLTAGKPGSYGFLCDIFCGSGHENMSGLIEVT